MKDGTRAKARPDLGPGSDHRPDHGGGHLFWRMALFPTRMRQFSPLTEDLGIGVKRRIGPGRMHAGDRDAVAGQFNPRRLGDHELSGLGGAISPIIRDAAQGQDGTGDHDLSAPTVARFLVTHHRHRRAQTFGRTDEIGVQKIPPFVGAGVGNTAKNAETSIAHQGIDAPQVCVCLGDEPLAVLGNGHIAGTGQVPITQFPHQFRQAIGRAGGQDQAATLPGEQHRQGPAYAG